MKHILTLAFLVTHSICYGQTTEHSYTMAMHCANPYRIKWQLRQELTLDWSTATEAFQQTFQHPRQPNFAYRIAQDVQNFHPIADKSWKLETTEYTETVEAVNVTERCLRVNSVTTKKSNGVIFDIVQFFGIERDSETRNVAFVLGFESCSVRRRHKHSPPSSAQENFMCNELSPQQVFLNDTKRYACLLELFPAGNRMDICRNLSAGIPPDVTHLRVLHRKK